MANCPYVPSPRRYPFSRTNDKQRARAARIRIGYDIFARLQLGFNAPRWGKTLRLLEETTPKQSERPLYSALRVVIPEKVQLDLPSPPGKLSVVNSSTLVVDQLFAVIEKSEGPTSVVFRGRRDVLVRIADEIMATYPGVRVHQLGHVSAVDYQSRCLWPSPKDGDNEDAAKQSLLTPDDNIWVHRERPQTIWIDTRYEDIPRPDTWTASSFESYIDTLVRSRIRSHLVRSLYRSGRLVDAEAPKVKLLVDAFNDASTQPFITPHLLKQTLAYMSRRGGHAARAHHLLEKCIWLGVPVDTDHFNVMMEAYVLRRNAAMFHGLVRQMARYYLYPNVTTWLLFLRLVQWDQKRLLVISSMYNLGFFDQPATRRCVAAVMAGRDAYLAFKAGQKSLYAYLSDQASRFGPDWLSTPALEAVLHEAFRFGHADWRSDVEDLLAIDPSTPIPSQTSPRTHHLQPPPLPQHPTPRLADDAPHPLPHAPTGPPAHGKDLPDAHPLARRSRAPFALGTLFFYAVIHRALRRSARLAMLYIFLGKDSDPFCAVAAAEWAILDRCHGYTPDQPLHEALAATWRTMDIPLHRIYHGGPGPRRPLRYFSVRMRNPDAATTTKRKMVVHLDSWFSHTHMIRGFHPLETSNINIDNNNDDDDDAKATAQADAFGDCYPLFRKFEPQSFGPLLEKLTGGRPTPEQVYRRIRDPSWGIQRGGAVGRVKRRLYWLKDGSRLRRWATRGLRRDLVRRSLLNLFYPPSSSRGKKWHRRRRGTCT
ncbi:pentatricopeptide repeat domain-containing protein [Ophiocordyceps camponoti-floridani]|uniref:Pentatricopeptide repeat domain-containing protein n=1 Tax=Ophiocordyceps camponoti-floridani TaxID=2030778 RepID=A0A8H4Q9K9_9HYPO|nr:pentatricopeptide repeat domain-containing protein [Ophiocordyceps camponoti-floridani]